MPSLDFDKEKTSFRDYYDQNLPFLKAAEDTFRTLVTALLAKNDSFPSPIVSSRIKDREECIKKFSVKYQTDLEGSGALYEIKNHITDLIGLRVTCYYEIDIPSVSKVLTDNFEVIGITDKTKSLEKKEDAFGYKGLHLDLELNSTRTGLLEYKQFEDLKFEIQIRTIIQHAWSELDHKIKYKKSPPQGLKRKINRLAALFELADQEFVSIRTETEKLERETLSKTSTVNTETTQDQFEEALKHLFELINKFSSQKESGLHAFDFLEIAQSAFPAYKFIPFRVDGFVQEIHNINANFSKEDLNRVIEENFEIVQKYAKYQDELGANLNPYTVIRHILYLSDKTSFDSILFDMQKRNFDKWLAEQNKT